MNAPPTDLLARESSSPIASQHPPPSRPIVPRIAAILLLLYCLGGTLLITFESARTISLQRDTTYPEAATAYVAILAGRTGHLYYSYSSPPYVVQPFGPLFYAANAAIAQASHWDPDLTIRRARLFAFVSFLLCGLLIFLIARKCQCSPAESALAALFLFAQPAFLNWNATMRPDLASLLLMLLSLLLALYEPQLGLWACACSGLVAGTGFLFKQSAIAAPAAIAAVFLLQKKFKQTFILAASAALPLLIAFAILLRRGEPFLAQFTAVGKSYWSIPSAALWLVTAGPLTMLVVPLIFGAAGLRRALRENAGSKMIASFALANFALALLTIPQIGGDVNYFLAALAGCALLLPFAIREYAPQVAERPAVAVLAIAIIVAGAAATASAWHWHWLSSPQTNISYAPFRSFKILSEFPYLPMHGRDPDMLDPFTVHVFELTGHWDPSPVVDKINREDYDVVVLYGAPRIVTYRDVSWFGTPIINAFNANYEVMCVAAKSAVFRPRFRQTSATPKIFEPLLGQCLPAPHGILPRLRIPPPAR